MTISSRLAYFGFIPQVTFNTPLAPTSFIRWLDGSMLEPELKTEEIFEGDGGRDASLVFKSGQSWKGKLVCYPRPIEMGHILKMIFGLTSDAISGAGPYTHTFTGKDSPGYYTIEFGQSDTALAAAGKAAIYRVQDCIATSFEIEGESNKPLKLTVDFMGRKAVRQSTVATVTLEAGEPFKYTNGLFKLDDGTGGAATDQSADIAKFKLNFSNNVDGDIYTNEIAPKDFIWTQRKITSEYELVFDSDKKFRQTFFGGMSGTTDSALLGYGEIDFKFWQGGDTGDADTLQLLVPKIAYQGKPITPKLDGKALRQEQVALAVKPASGSIISAVLINTRSTAY